PIFVEINFHTITVSFDYYNDYFNNDHNYNYYKSDDYNLGEMVVDDKLVVVVVFLMEGGVFNTDEVEKMCEITFVHVGTGPFIFEISFYSTEFGNSSISISFPRDGIVFSINGYVLSILSLKDPIFVEINFHTITVSFDYYNDYFNNDHNYNYYKSDDYNLGEMVVDDKLVVVVVFLMEGGVFNTDEVEVVVNDLVVVEVLLLLLEVLDVYCDFRVT
nr:hypothetical protein [Tanacetum cinerariifolium]